MAAARLLLSFAICVGLASSASRAGDEPSARTGRISAVVGAVSYHSGGGDWAEALVNEPVAAGTGLRNGRAAQAELEIAGDRIALAASGELKVLRLDRDTLEIALLQGRIGVHLVGPGVAGTVEIDLPQGGVWLAVPGDYDIVAGDGQTPAHIAVFSGSAHVGGGLAPGNIGIASADTFSEWWRGSGGDEPPASRYVSPTITGADALAGNGKWQSDDTYGEVWYPNQAAEGWAPFRYGRWRFLAPAGWTWIDDAAWGFAPSHYGRWARVNERWAWVPGPRSDNPAYSPATVAFLGTAGIGLSRPGDVGPAVAWFPLAPDEIADDPDAPYHNRRFASIVPRALFAGGKPVADALVELPEWRLDNAPVILGGLHIAAAGAAPPAKPAHLAAAPPPKPIPLEKARQIFLARVRETLKYAVRKKPAPAHTMATASRPHPPLSTTPTHPSHNRPHLAAARGGGQ